MATSKANHIHTLLLHYFITTKQVLVVLLLVVVVLPVASLSFQGDFDHYDEIRKRENAFPIFGDSDNAYVGRNLHRRIDTNNKNSSLLFCHVPIFQRYSSESGDASSCHIAYSASAASLLAMHHFNTGDGSVVDQLHQINHTCKMVMTTEIVDTTSSALSAVRDLTRMITRPSQDFERPQPCAILGSQISSVTSKLASLTGVFDLFQVSSSAMSTELENAKQ